MAKSSLVAGTNSMWRKKMAAENIGKAKSGSGRTFDVLWNASDKQVYVGYAGTTRIGTAQSAAQAQRMAEAWLASK